MVAVIYTLLTPPWSSSFEDLDVAICKVSIGIILALNTTPPVTAVYISVGFGWLVDEVVWACTIAELVIDVDI